MNHHSSNERIQPTMNHTSTSLVTLAPRPDVRFDFSTTPAVHHADNPYLSHFWNALSILAPATERAVIRIARAVRDDVADEQIRHDVDALVAQEALHTREHRRLNARLEELGYPVSESTAEMDRILDDCVARLDTQSALALIVAGEHLIYELCRALIADPAATNGMDAEVRRLLTWHAAEELEHQSVAHDVYVHLYGDGPGSRLRRARAFATALRLLGVGAFRIHRRLLASEPSTDRAAQFAAFSRYMVLSPAYGRTVAARSARFLLPGFRPWHDTDDTQRIHTAIASL